MSLDRIADRTGPHHLAVMGALHLAEGRVLAEGTIDEIKANEQVIEAYLGTGLKNKAGGAAEAAQ